MCIRDRDITVDALRIEQIGEHESKSMAAGAAMAVVGWWSGYKLGGVIDLFTAEYLENIGISNYWQITFLILICLIVWSIINPTDNLSLLITVGLIIAIASATQDITVDALRIEQIGENESKSMAAGAAMALSLIHISEPTRRS